MTRLLCALVALALYGRGRVLAVGLPARQRSRGDDDLRVAFGRVGLPLGRPRVLLRRPRTGVPAFWRSAAVALDASDASDAALLAGRCATRGCFQTIPVLLAKPRGAGLGAPVALGRRGRLRATDVAMNSRGDVLATWMLDGVVRARLRTAGGRLGPVQRLGRARGARAAPEAGSLASATPSATCGVRGSSRAPCASATRTTKRGPSRPVTPR